MGLKRTKEAAKILGMHPNTLRKYADEGEIPHIHNKAGQRLYDTDAYLKDRSPPQLVCYCRASSRPQMDDLARQVVYMQQKFPEAEIVKDVGSGLNYKRKGLRSLLERAMSGEKLTVVVTHRDRLARFGFELIQFVLEHAGGSVMVLDDTLHSPEDELTRDLVSIINIFACRLHGLRKYSRQVSQDPDLPRR
jgi:putative resolvase